MLMNNDLFAELIECDLKTTSSIKRIYACFCEHENFITELFNLFSCPDVEREATWLFKHHCENKAISLNSTECESFYSSAICLQHWEATLHVLQVMEYVKMPLRQSSAIYDFLQKCTEHENKMVRAWAYYGLAVFAVSFPEKKTEILATLTQVKELEAAASIKVRLRKAHALLS